MKFIYYVNKKPIYESPTINKMRGRKVYYCSHSHINILSDSLSTIQESFIKQENLPDFGKWQRKTFLCRFRKNIR